MSEAGSRPGEPGTLDVVALLQALHRHDVDVVVIGAVAVGHHGFVRATKDLDIVPSPEEANLRRLWNALSEIEARPRAIGDFRENEVVPLSLESLLLGGNWDLTTRYGRLDVMQYVEGALEDVADYTRLRSNAETLDLDFGSVPVVGYADLVDLKMLAGRGQDLVDVRALSEARDDTAPA